MEKPNTFEFTPMVRFDYSFPNVDAKTRLKIYDAIYDRNIQTYSGGGGDGSNNSGVKYIPASEVEGLRQRLAAFGFVEVGQSESSESLESLDDFLEEELGEDASPFLG
jgi:hypothetical protein